MARLVQGQSCLAFTNEVDSAPFWPMVESTSEKRLNSRFLSILEQARITQIVRPIATRDDDAVTGSDPSGCLDRNAVIQKGAKMACDTLSVQIPTRRDSTHGRQAKIRVIVADDHELVREGLRHVFRGTRIEVVGEAATADDAIRLARDIACDVVLLDLGWPEGQRTRPRGFDVLRAIKASQPALPVLVHSMHDRESYKNRCREMGASGYIVKGTSNVRLVEAICNCGRLAENQT